MISKISTVLWPKQKTMIRENAPKLTNTKHLKYGENFESLKSIKFMHQLNLSKIESNFYTQNSIH